MTSSSYSSYMDGLATEDERRTDRGTVNPQRRGRSSSIDFAAATKIRHCHRGPPGKTNKERAGHVGSPLSTNASTWVQGVSVVALRLCLAVSLAQGVRQVAFGHDDDMSQS
ncbi:hypothetical protein E5D57_005157 [Metarhizium anisopliae]|nr:hypothetical protein E5D57_005157 [Metarhizium anisopliae]